MKSGESERTAGDFRLSVLSNASLGQSSVKCASRAACAKDAKLYCDAELSFTCYDTKIRGIGVPPLGGWTCICMCS